MKHIELLRDQLGNRHYFRKAKSRRGDHFFDFAVGKVQTYRSKYGDDFLCVVYASDNDVHPLPYRVLTPVFRKEFIDKGRNRWFGTITHGVLHVRGGAPPLNVRQYHRTSEFFDLLDR